MLIPRATPRQSSWGTGPPSLVAMEHDRTLTGTPPDFFAWHGADFLRVSFVMRLAATWRVCSGGIGRPADKRGKPRPLPCAIRGLARARDLSDNEWIAFAAAEAPRRRSKLMRRAPAHRAAGVLLEQNRFRSQKPVVSELTTLFTEWYRSNSDTQRRCTVRQQSANRRHSTTALRMGAADPELPFKIGPTNGREARENGLSLW